MISTTEKWLTVLLVVGLVGSGVYCFQRWVIYAHPKIETKAETHVAENKSIRHHTVKTTTTTTPTKEGPVVTVVEEKDLTVEETHTVASALTSSLSVPILPPGPRFGVSFEREWLFQEYSFGVVARPLDILDVYVKTNLGLNRLSTGVNLWVK